MKVCHVCKTECEDYAELCPLCGADLTQESEQGLETAECDEEILLKNPVLLTTFDDVVSAEIFKDILKDNGIPYSCGEPDNQSGIKVVFGGGFVADDIYVESDDFEKADKLYSEFLQSEAEFEGDFIFEDEEAGE